MTAPPPVIDRDNLGQGPLIMGVTWTFQILSIVAIIARLTVRKVKAITWSWDDYLMLLAVLLQLGLQALTTNSYTHGLGKHDHSLYIDEFIIILKHNFLSVPPGILVGLLSRTSIAILLIRLFPPYRWFTYYLIVFTVLMWIIGIACMPITFLQSTPVEGLWDLTMVGVKSWDKRIWLYSAYLFQSCCTFSDLTYALFPVIFIWRLNMPLRQRLSLVFVMSGSIVSMVMSILKTISMAEIANVKPGAVDVQYRASFQLIYGYTEQSLVIIIGCLPPMRALMKLDFSQLSLVRRYYMYRSKRSASEYGTNGYTDLDTDTHKLSHINGTKGSTQASVDAVGSFGGTRNHGGSDEQLVVVQGQITRTDRYTVTYDAKDRATKERS